MLAEQLMSSEVVSETYLRYNVVFSLRLPSFLVWLVDDHKHSVAWKPVNAKSDHYTSLQKQLNNQQQMNNPLFVCSLTRHICILSLSLYRKLLNVDKHTN
jgi:hypothetical protein